MIEAIPLLSDYIDDRQYFTDFEYNYHKIPKDQMLLHLNYRNTKRGIDCLFKNCEMPLWATDYELVKGVHFKKNYTFSRLLVEYTCGEHIGIYEAIPLKNIYLIEDY